MKQTLFSCVVLALSCCHNAEAATTVLSVPFICEWANTSGGCPNGDYLHSANCGPTSVLMVASAYNNTAPTANQINQLDDWLYARYGAAYGNPGANNYLGYGTTTTELAALAMGFPQFGFSQSTAFSGWKKEQLKQELATGYPVVVYVATWMMTHKKYYAHYMVLLGMDSQNVYVNDPGRSGGGQVAYPLTNFLAAWAWHNNAGVTIHPNRPPPQPTWTQHFPSISPPGTEFAGLAYDSARNNTVLFGGLNQNGSISNSTWTWDGVNWTQRFPTASPSPTEGYAIAYDAGHGRTVLFGGSVPLGNQGAPANNETWLWDGTNWTQAFPATSPPIGSYAMAYDSVRSQIVLFGDSCLPVPMGNFLQCTSIAISETWTWDGSTWTQKIPSTVPPARSYPAMAFDAAHGKTVAFGGTCDAGACGFTEFLAETWLWDGSNWAMSPALGPVGRRGASMAYDALYQRVVLFGGQTQSPSPPFVQPYLNDTWLWDGSNWSQALPGTSPTARKFQAMAYDAARAQLVLFGGEINATIYTAGDTWVYGPPTAGFTMSGLSPPPVTVTKTDGQTLTVYTSPGGTASVTFDATTRASGTSGATITGWQWTINGSPAATTSTFTQLLPASGSIGQSLTYQVNLVITDSNGFQSQPAQATVVVKNCVFICEI